MTHEKGAPEALPSMIGNFSKIFKQIEPGRWKHIPAEPYKKETSAYRGITRFELIGKRGESTGFHTRYFEIESGGFSSYEQHDHEHVIVVLRGKGQVRLGCRYITLEKGDVTYVSPQDPHQFLNPDSIENSIENLIENSNEKLDSGSSEPFGFLCMVHAQRDRPRSVDGNESCKICE